MAVLAPLLLGDPPCWGTLLAAERSSLTVSEGLHGIHPRCPNGGHERGEGRDREDRKGQQPEGLPIRRTHAEQHSTEEAGQRRAVTAILAMAVSLCFATAFSESFFLKLDKIQFFVLFWGVLLLENRDANNIEAEFRGLTAEDEDEMTNRARPFRTRLGHHL